MQKPWLDETQAANGRPVKENFADWFGESKARGVSGEPLRFFHGTAAAFAVFDATANRSVLNQKYQGDGFHFSESAEVASDYADSARNQFINKGLIFDLVDRKLPPLAARTFKSVVDHGYDATWDIPDEQIAAVLKESQDLGLDLNTALDIAMWVESSNYYKGRERAFDAGMIFGSQQSSLPDWVRADAVALGLEDALPNPSVMPVYLQITRLLKTSSKKAAKSAQAKGFDGVCYCGEGAVRGEPEWIVFKPEQIKSALGNSGLYLKDSTSLNDSKGIALAIAKANKAKAVVQKANKKASHAKALA